MIRFSKAILRGHRPPAGGAMVFFLWSEWRARRRTPLVAAQLMDVSR
jgi:hypothetical protein